MRVRVVASRVVASSDAVQHGLPAKPLVSEVGLLGPIEDFRTVSNPDIFAQARDIRVARKLSSETKAAFEANH